MNLNVNKMMFVFTLASLVLSSGFAHAAEPHDYACIAQTLEAYNSDLYYDLTPAEIDEIMNGTTDRRRELVISVAQTCDANARAVCDDELLEAKFLGHIENLNYSQDSEAGNMPHTTFGIGKFLSYTPNPFCGLDAAQAEKALFWTQGQSTLHNGQEVAGTIRYSKRNGNYTLLGVNVAK
jgi:hypothetical protein